MFTPPTVDLPGRFLAHSRLRIYVETYGDASRPAILLTHGAWQSSKCWRKQVQELSQHWFVIAWDIPYHGFSGPYGEEKARLEPGEDYFAESMRAVVEAFGLREKGFVQVAWSLGGLVTDNYLLTYGVQGLHGIVLVGTLLNLAESMGKRPQETQAFTADLLSSNAEVKHKSFLELINALWYRIPSQDEFLITLGYNTQAMIRFNMDMPIVEGDTVALLHQHQLPVLFIQGENDILAPMPLVQELAKEYPPHTLIEYAECGHSPFLEYPERFNQDVHAFVTMVTHGTTSSRS